MKKRGKSGSGRSTLLKEVLIGFSIAAVLIATMSGIKYFARKEPPKIPSPAELVDRAWSIPGAIVISPNRDLNTLGIVESSWDVRVSAPSIGVHTRSGRWCIWNLGRGWIHFPDQADKGDKINLKDTWYVGDAFGYQSAYDRFKECVDEGNKLAEKSITITGGKIVNGLH